MRNASTFALLAGVAAAALIGVPASAGQAMKAFTGPAYAPLASQNSSGFGEPIVFVPSAYTPDRIGSLAFSPLPSQNLSGFGEAIVFIPSGYTPPGIVALDAIDLATTR